VKERSQEGEGMVAILKAQSVGKSSDMVSSMNKKLAVKRA
jgi:hypothetical protein